MERTELTSVDEGKRVLNADGTAVGRLVRVDDGHGYVDPDPTIVTTLRAKLGLRPDGTAAHPLDAGSIEEITDDAVRLRGTL
jgi:hypothetical protein